jgi:hypothetical protein
LLPALGDFFAVSFCNAWSKTGNYEWVIGFAMMLKEEGMREE